MSANFPSSNFTSGAFIRTTTGYVNVLFVRSMTGDPEQTTLTLDDGSTHTVDAPVDALASALGVAGPLLPAPAPTTPGHRSTPQEDMDRTVTGAVMSQLSMKNQPKNPA